MRRSPLDLALKDPDRRVKLFKLINFAIILTTFMMVFGVILFILITFGVIHF
ncbi:hypothetical protein [Methanobrevibacter sp. 87.7]|uniref:hypothetical protein n=1 Tax=Methanobrevibacter sp. 87.7 TaxID=387957 RepID=UPI0018EA26F6|nr:hypothetical protein [Methanobrevibacter sp. 87.7]